MDVVSHDPDDFNLDIAVVEIQGVARLYRLGKAVKGHRDTPTVSENILGRQDERVPWF